MEGGRTSEFWRHVALQNGATEDTIARVPPGLRKEPAINSDDSFVLAVCRMRLDSRAWFTTCSRIACGLVPDATLRRIHPTRARVQRSLCSLDLDSWKELHRVLRLIGSLRTYVSPTSLDLHSTSPPIESRNLFAPIADFLNFCERLIGHFDRGVSIGEFREEKEIAVETNTKKCLWAGKSQTTPSEDGVALEFSRVQRRFAKSYLKVQARVCKQKLVRDRTRGGGEYGREKHNKSPWTLEMIKER